MLRSDRRLTRLILVNLVGNALKFTSVGGVDVALRARRVGASRRWYSALASSSRW